MIFQIDPFRRYKGDSGGGGGGVTMVDPYAGTGIRELYKQLNDWIGPQIGQGVQPYSGQIAPGPTNLQQQAYSTAGGIDPVAQGGLSAFQQALGSYKPETSGNFLDMAQDPLQMALGQYDPTSATKAWQENLKPAAELWKSDVVPFIQEKYAGQNAADSGAMNRALARSGQTFASNQSAQLANAIYGGEQAHLGRQTQNIGMAGQLSQVPGQNLAQMGQVGGMGTDLLSQMLNIGGSQRGIQGEQSAEEANKWAYSQPYNNPYLQNFLGTALQQPGMDYYSNFGGGDGGAGNAAMLGSLGSMIGGSQGGFLGGSGGTGGGGILGDSSPTGGTGSDIQLAMQIAAMFSDRRVKKDIKPITGALDKVKKLDGYSYTYTGRTDRNGGVMAQDIEKVLPDAVSEIDGVKYVRYDAVVGLLVEAVKELAERQVV